MAKSWSERLQHIDHRLQGHGVHGQAKLHLARKFLLVETMGISKGNRWEIDGKYHGFMGFPREIDGKYDGYMMGYEWDIHENIIRTECNGGAWDLKPTTKMGVVYRLKKPHPIPSVRIFGTGWLKGNSHN